MAGDDETLRAVHRSSGESSNAAEDCFIRFLGRHAGSEWTLLEWTASWLKHCKKAPGDFACSTAWSFLTECRRQGGRVTATVVPENRAIEIRLIEDSNRGDN